MSEFDILPDNIRSQIMEIIDGISEKSNETVGQFINRLKIGEGISFGQAGMCNIIDIRREVLEQYKEIKADILNIVSQAMKQKKEVDTLYKVKDLNNKIKDLKEAEKAAVKEKERMEEIKTLSQVEKYDRYRKSDDFIEANKVYEENLLKEERCLIIGETVTVVCVALDFCIIRFLLLSANMSYEFAYWGALIIAGFTGVSFYILGNHLKRMNDKKELWELQYDDINQNSSFDTNRYNFGRKSIFFSMFFISLLYLALSFWGILIGSEFSLLFHLMVNGVIVFENIELVSLQAVLIVVLFITMIMEFTLGRMLTFSDIDHLKKLIPIIDENLLLHIKKHEETINNCCKERKIIEGEMNRLKEEIKMSYLDKNLDFENTDIFICQVLDINQQIESQMFERCCCLLVDKAKETLKYIDRELSVYVINYEGKLAEISRGEEAILENLKTEEGSSLS